VAVSSDRQQRFKARLQSEDPEEWRRRTRAIQANFRKAHPEKKSAWNKVYKAVKAGLLTRPEMCGRCSLECVPEASHDDYTRPLDVEWLCKSCHAEKDQTLRRSA
jgi:hypothetical protein